MKHSSVVRCVHRGASALYPAKTWLAFCHAIEQGVDVLEIDIHRIADDQLVILHDARLQRTTNGHGNVRDHTLHDIRQLDAGQGEKFPLLEEAIQLAHKAQIRLCVEIKGATELEELVIAEAVIRTLESTNFLSYAIVTSFSPQALLRAKALQPELSTMLDPSLQVGSLTPRQVCAQALRAGANCLSCGYCFLTPAIITECRLTGLAIWPWVPDEPDDIRRMLGLGVQGIMTNRPDVLNEVLHASTF